MLLARMRPGDRVEIYDTSGEYLGKVELISTKDGRRATGIDLPKDYKLKFVKYAKPVLAGVMVPEGDDWEIPEEAGNEC